MESYEYQGKFLDPVPVKNRSMIVNLFCHAARAGCQTAETVLLHVYNTTLRRLRSHEQFASSSQREQIEPIKTLVDLIDNERDLAIEFAEFILKRERLSQVEKDRLKASRSKAYQREYMKGMPPTEKQLAYLKGLGCQTVPSNRAEASELIEEWKDRASNK